MLTTSLVNQLLSPIEREIRDLEIQATYSIEPPSSQSSLYHSIATLYELNGRNKQNIDERFFNYRRSYSAIEAAMALSPKEHYMKFREKLYRNFYSELDKTINQLSSERNNITGISSFEMALNHIPVSFIHELRTKLSSASDYFGIFKNGFIDYKKDNGIELCRKTRLLITLERMILIASSDQKRHVSSLNFYYNQIKKRFESLKSIRNKKAETYQELIAYNEIFILIFNLQNKNQETIANYHHAISSYYLSLKTKLSGIEKQKAIEHSLEHISMSRKLNPANPHHRIMELNCLEALGTFYQIQKNPTAIAYFRNVLQNSTDVSFDSFSVLYSHFGVLKFYSSSTMPSDQKNQLEIERSIQFLTSEMPRFRVATQVNIHHELGCYYFRENQYNIAETHLLKSLELKKKLNSSVLKDPTIHQLAAVCVKQASILRKENRFQESRDKLREAYNLSRINSEPRKQGVILSKISSSLFHEKTGDQLRYQKSACTDQYEAIKLLHQSFREDFPEISEPVVPNKPYNQIVALFKESYSKKNYAEAFQCAKEYAQDIQRRGSDEKKIRKMPSHP